MKGLKGSLKERIALLRIKNGDSEAFGYIYDSYADRIYRYVFFRVSDASRAFDIMQEVFLQAWESIVNGTSVSNIGGYLYRIAYYKIVDFYRGRDRQTSLIADIDERELQRLRNVESVDGAEVTILYRHIQQLKSEYQDIILLKHVEGLSINEIAEILEKDPNNTRVILHRAMNELKERFHGASDNND